MGEAGTQIRDLEAGREAIARRAWAEAYDLLGAADARANLEPADLDRLGAAAWWTGRHRESIDSTERAYAAYAERGDREAAARSALKLRRMHASMLAGSAANGWLARAEKLINLDARSVAAGYLRIAHGEIAWQQGMFDEALLQVREALHIAEGSDDRDLLAWAVMREGMILVSMGRLDEGWSLMEEVSAAAVGGELGSYTTAAVFCNVVEMSRDMADFARAREWSDAAKRWCERQAIAGFPGMCRVHRAEVMRLMGAWADAEQEAHRASVELRDFNPLYAGMAFHELGEVRLRMGQLEAAEEAFRQANELGGDPQPGLALLRLAQGKVDAAMSSIQRSLEERTWDKPARARMLPAKAEIARAAGNVDAARVAAGELEAIAEEFDTTAIHAGAAWARGLADLTAGDATAAVRDLRMARQRWREVDAPYEAARTGAFLAEAHEAEGDAEAAVMELEGARSAFERLGARLDAERAADRLAALRRSPDRYTVTRKTFMFTDIVGSTTLLEAIGDEAWNDLRRWHDQTLRDSVAAYGGEEVDHSGDGFFVSFEDAGSAVSCAQDIQRRLAAHRRDHGFAPQVRIGLHGAQATREGSRYSGIGVHAAARIGALAGAGEILGSASSVEGLDEVTLTDRRQATLKGIAESIEIVSIAWS